MSRGAETALQLLQKETSSVDDIMRQIQEMALDPSRAASARSRDSFTRASEASVNSSCTSRMSTSHSSRSFSLGANETDSKPSAVNAGARALRRVHIRCPDEPVNRHSFSLMNFMQYGNT